MFTGGYAFVVLLLLNGPLSVMAVRNQMSLDVSFLDQACHEDIDDIDAVDAP